MLDRIFASVITETTLTFAAFAACVGTAIVLGVITSIVYTICNQSSKSFAVTLAMLPAIVSVIILMVSGSLGAGLAVAGTFSLVRFRSAPGTGREIGSVFLAVAIGLACGMGYVGYAAVAAVILWGCYLLLSLTPFGEKRDAERQKILQITVPEDLSYGTMFDELFEKYTDYVRLLKVKTANFGSLNRLTYEITEKDPSQEKAFVDDLRCLNGNLEISLSLRQSESEL